LSARVRRAFDVFGDRLPEFAAMVAALPMKVTARAGRTLARIVIVDQNQQCCTAPCTDCSAQLPVAAPSTILVDSSRQHRRAESPSIEIGFELTVLAQEPRPDSDCAQTAAASTVAEVTGQTSGDISTAVSQLTVINTGTGNPVTPPKHVIRSRLSFIVPRLGSEQSSVRRSTPLGRSGLLHLLGLTLGRRHVLSRNRRHSTLISVLICMNQLGDGVFRRTTQPVGVNVSTAVHVCTN